MESLWRFCSANFRITLLVLHLTLFDVVKNLKYQFIETYRKFYASSKFLISSSLRESGGYVILLSIVTMG
jgi:hypothetical protein